MEYEESIYNIIPKETYQPPKPKRYKSKHPAQMPPTASTFCVGTTSKPGVGNLNGDYNAETSNHTNKAHNGTFGKKAGEVREDPNHFKKKGTGQPILPKSKSFHLIS
jgi:hypothetical protein